MKAIAGTFLNGTMAVPVLAVLVSCVLNQPVHGAPWAETGPLNLARHSHTATLLLNGT
jgi:hypothetical protein